ncbi:uncharacterized protein LOC107614131 [Arachis ipaensis]|uniref:Uncharacterized protein n=1 Tax=Arachis hypogaea TaxID=3818 RepID=A0A444Y374_ARAHY|nr:uncharacterized protein LOC107614131 [Arachis ipaensis]XP_025671469.1 uncharacterized protein LOC112771084 isoform X2 [Arachis hypogaea]XP_025671470.1 uncharacterized protein LOC112771084 isoform X2 [Arachis hypogaea]XP_025671471.1 uncharacterized protein LOC112771084 isoform X2 [Arachis hypogaea]XP_025671473.1 uncharacterized protein LOC112771084 isoform X2 [Arachis hypogaea]XP_025671474.1 uncharacterized protein LOC112771084 isoform X2 [Arachis hypogaea]XP_025671475.1 uncharacterized pro
MPIYTMGIQESNRIHYGKSQSSVELGTSSGAMMPFGGLNNMRQPDNNNSSGSPSAGKSLEATSFSKGTESAIMTGDKGILSEERKHLLAVKKVELEKQIQERAGAQASSTTSFQQQDSSSTKGDVDSVWRPSVLGTNITLGDKRIGIKTSVLEEKATACNMLCCYADELKEGFFPWIDQVAGTLVPLLKFYFHEELRKAAVSAMPELLRSAKLAIEKGQSQGRDASYLKFLSDSIIPVLVDALHKELN